MGSSPFTANMKIIFLDIDGVLNHRNSPCDGGIFIIDTTLVPILARIVQATGAEIVLSSTWRILAKNREAVQRALAVHDMKFIGRTDQLNAERSVEILEWLHRHPQVTKFAILDDDRDAGSNGLGEYFFQTNWNNGLTDEIADRVITHLKD